MRKVAPQTSMHPPLGILELFDVLLAITVPGSSQRLPKAGSHSFWRPPMGIFTLCDILRAIAVPRSEQRLHKMPPHSYMRPAVDILSLSEVLTAFAVPRSRQRLPAEGCTAFMVAAGNGHLDVVRCLANEFGANIEAIDA